MERNPRGVRARYAQCLMWSYFGVPAGAAGCSALLRPVSFFSAPLTAESRPLVPTPPAAPSSERVPDAPPGRWSLVTTVTFMPSLIPVMVAPTRDGEAAMNLKAPILEECRHIIGGVPFFISQFGMRVEVLPPFPHVGGGVQ